MSRFPSLHLSFIGLTDGVISPRSEEQPAFFHQYEYLRGHKLGVIKFNPAVAERMSRDSIAETLHPRHLPMLIKPKPWLSYNNGGYMYNRSWAMRFKESREQEVYLRHASDAGRLELVFAGLDVLGSTPWRINRRVFDVVLEVWNKGERFCKIPPAVPDEPEPERPPNMEFDNKAKTIYIERQKAWQQAKAANHSDRCSVNYKVEIARAVSTLLVSCVTMDSLFDFVVPRRHYLLPAQCRLPRACVPDPAPLEPHRRRPESRPAPLR